MHSFHGTFIRNCIVTHVIDGKTIRVLLNPDGGQQRSSTGDGWEDSLVVGSEPTSRIPSDELDASIEATPTTYFVTLIIAFACALVESLPITSIVDDNFSVAITAIACGSLLY